VDVKVYLLQMKQEYKKCFDQYMMQSTKFKRVKTNKTFIIN